MITVSNISAAVTGTTYRFPQETSLKKFMQNTKSIVSQCSNIQFITSGGGSKAWRGDIRKWDPEELKLYYDGQGFMSVQMTDSTAAFAFYDAYGSVLHQWSISKESHSAA